MKKMKRAVTTLSLFAIALLSSCGGEPVTTNPSTTATTNTGDTGTGTTSTDPIEESEFYVVFKGEEYEAGTNLKMTVGEGVAIFSAYMTDGSDGSFKVTTSDDTVIQVRNGGTVYPLKAGTATITVAEASNASEKMEFVVTVEDATVVPGGHSYATVSYDEKSRILGSLEKYAVDHYLTGITLFSNGSNVCYNTRYEPLPKSYISGYGWGTTREGSFKEDLKNPLGGHGDYYNIATTSLPAHANAINASGSDVSTVYGYIADAYYQTRLNETNDGYEWYPSLATDDRPISVDENGVAYEKTDAKYNYNKRWRIHLRDDVVYRTGSSKDNVKTYDQKKVALEDYLTPIKFALTAWNNQYRGAEMTSGVSGFEGAENYYGETKANKTGDTTALWDNTLWEKYMAKNIKVGTDDKGNFIEFNLLYPCTQFYAMYYLSSTLYSPLPEAFIKMWGPKGLGKFPNGATPVDTMLSVGPYYITDWQTQKVVNFKKNDSYFWKEDVFTHGDKVNKRKVYNIGGISYNQVSDATISKNNFLSGQTDSYSPNKDELANEFKSTNGEGTNGAMSWRKYETLGDSNFKINVNASTKQQWLQRFGPTGTIYQHAAGVESTATWSGVKPYMSDPHFLNFLSFSLDRKSICEARGMKPTQEYFADNYLINPEDGTTYNSTPAHKAVLANRYNDTFGYNVDAAKDELREVMDGTITDMVEAGLLETENSGAGAGSSANPYLIPITMEWMNTNDKTDYADVFTSIIRVFDEVIAEDYSGGYKLNIIETNGSSDYEEVYNKMRRGEFDLGFGAISGNSLNPLNFMEVLKSDNSSGFTLNWGPDTSKIDADDPIVYDGKKWSYDSLWAAGDSAALLTKTGDIANTVNVSTKGTGNNKYESYDATAGAEKVVYKLSFKQLIEAGAANIRIRLSNASAAGDTYSLEESGATSANDYVGTFEVGAAYNTAIVEGDDGSETTEDANTVTFTFTYTAVINGAETSFTTTLTLLTGRGIKNSEKKS